MIDRKHRYGVLDGVAFGVSRRVRRADEQPAPRTRPRHAKSTKLLVFGNIRK
jgi:hypothetical protein